MKKIKISKTHISDEGGNGSDIKLTLLKKLPRNTSSDSDYAILSETDNDISFIDAGKNSAIAHLLFDFLLSEGVTPRNLEDIEEDYNGL